MTGLHLQLCKLARIAEIHHHNSQPISPDQAGDLALNLNDAAIVAKRIEEINQKLEEYAQKLETQNRHYEELFWSAMTKAKGGVQ